MNSIFDIGQFVEAVTEQRVREEVIGRVKERRKEIGLTQRGLAARSGVSYASVRRFESSGEIAFSSLLKIASALHALEDFRLIFSREIVRDLKDY